VLGNFTSHKGSDIVAQSMVMLDGREFEFHIFGRLDPSYNWLSAPGRFPAVHVHGTYDPGKIPAALDTCDISLHLSIFPETYCLTLSECLARGLVPIVSDIGALGERIIDGVNGLKVAPNAEGELVQALRRLAETPGLLDTLRAASSATPIGRFDTHRNELCAVYDPLIMAHTLSANAGQEASPLSLARLQRPEVHSWFIPIGAQDHQVRQRKLTRLLRRGLKHLRTHGFVSTVRVGSHFVARHL
jgi:glycosyltransferase involved in cell wall biosynthesis